MTISLYPERKPYEAGFFAVDGHELYFERHGSPDAPEKVVYLHGGPGAGCSYKEYRWFDPEVYDVLLFDQRWAPKSKGRGPNGIDAAVADIEKLREHFGHQAWNVAGGSWGAALATIYAVRHPSRVKRLLLRGVFLADAVGARYIIEEDGAAAQNKNRWFREYQAHIPAAERAGGLMQAYYRRVMQDNAEAVEAARLLSRWNTSILTLHPRPELIDAEDATPDENLALARTFLHFSVAEFRETLKSEVLGGIAKLDIPIEIIHGRQDHICPIEDAFLLHSRCKNSRLYIIEQCGHGMIEPGLQRAFMGATDGWRQDAC